ncbi:MAG: hypothetical protein J4F48_12860, partial [Nitrospinae bacterium]|nr:hypothetical protein [Nitrospinota bacterium]
MSPARRYDQVRNKSLVFVVLMVACASLSACGEERSQKNDAIVVGIGTNPTQLDPRLSQDAISSKVQRFIFSRLISQDHEGRIVLELAERWERPT